MNPISLSGWSGTSFTVEESSESSKEDAQQSTGPVRDVSQHAHAPTGESALTSKSSHRSSEDRDRTPSSESMQFFILLKPLVLVRYSFLALETPFWTPFNTGDSFLTVETPF
ncbi:genetic suppressor element 1 isoform X1 [Tachysurus ichikawai]